MGFRFRQAEAPSGDETALWRILLGIFLGFLLGTGWIVAYAWQAPGWGQFFTLLGVACMLSGAFFISGGFLGFLFGMPRAVPGERGGEGAEAAAGQAQEELTFPNTNLQQISDWLTKILVGVGLTQLGSLPEVLKRYAAYAVPGLGNYANSGIFAVGLLIYYLTFGFLSGFLLTKLYLAGAIRKAEKETLAEKLARVEQTLLQEQEQKRRDQEALRLVQLQLQGGPGTPRPSQEELNAKIKAASPGARTQAFYLAAAWRSQNWRDPATKPRMARAIPVFKALIASDEEGRYHRNHGELGFALKDKEPPDYEGAVRELTRAIEIREARQEKGWLNYEFNRALARLALLKRGPNEELEQEILHDLKAAIQDETLKERLKTIKELKNWLEKHHLSLT